MLMYKSRSACQLHQGQSLNRCMNKQLAERISDLQICLLFGHQSNAETDAIMDLNLSDGLNLKYRSISNLLHQRPRKLWKY